MTHALLFAAAAAFGGYSLIDVAVFVVVVAAVVALVFLALRHFEITVPPQVMHAIWIVIIAFIVIVAIKTVASL